MGIDHILLYLDLYHSAFPNDGLFRKILVSVVYLLDAAQTFVVTGDVFQIYAKHYGEVEQLSAMHNEWLAVPVFSSIGEHGPIYDHVCASSLF